jgi:hypothetical protein
MEEKPFESLAKGLDKDLSLLSVTAELGSGPKSTLLISLVPGFGVTNLPLGMRMSQRLSFGHQPFPSLSDRFAQQIAVFPLSNHVVMNEFGAFIPQSIFGNQTEIAYKEERLPDGAINITIHAKHPTPPLKRPQFGSARGLIKMSDNFDEPLEDFVNYM